MGSPIDNLRACRVRLDGGAGAPAIATFATEDSVPAGTTLTRWGDYSNEMVAIESGTADVIQGGSKVADLGPGDVFGEMGVRERACGPPRLSRARRCA